MKNNKFLNKIENFLLSYWNGEQKLWKAFWLMGFVFQILFLYSKKLSRLSYSFIAFISSFIFWCADWINLVYKSNDFFIIKYISNMDFSFYMELRI